MRMTKHLFFIVAALWLTGCGEEINKANLLTGKWDYVSGESLSPVKDSTLSFDQGVMSIESATAPIPGGPAGYALAAIPVEVGGETISSTNKKIKLTTRIGRGKDTTIETDSGTVRWLVGGIQPGTAIKYEVRGNELYLTDADGKQGVYKRK